MTELEMFFVAVWLLLGLTLFGAIENNVAKRRSAYHLGTVLNDDGTKSYYLYYHDWAAFTAGLASSSDGSLWIKGSSNPVLNRK